MEIYSQLAIPFITGIFAILTASITFWLSIKHQQNNRKKIFKIIKEMNYLKSNNQLKAAIIADYEKEVINDLKGIYIKPGDYLSLKETGIFDNKFTNTQIKMASKFISFTKDNISVSIPWYESLKSWSVLVSSFFVILFGALTLFFLAPKDTSNLQTGLIILSSLFSMILGFSLIWNFSAPANVAKMIKKEIEAIDKSKTY